MIVLFTDFGVHDPYVGQVHSVLRQSQWDGPVIDLLHNAPSFDVQASAYLLAALVEYLPTSCVVMAVVDPGVGSERAPIMLRAGGRWLLGPDNGLLSVVMARAPGCACHRIDWQPPSLSASFHGRDLFAPVAAMLARGEVPAHSADFTPVDTRHWPADLLQIIYIDHYGNAITGLRADQLQQGRQLRINDQVLPQRRTFAEAPPGTAFWYCNANGLVEIAVNQGSAAGQLGIGVGAAFSVI